MTQENRTASQEVVQPRIGRASRQIRLRTVVWLRWVAVGGQLTTLLLVAFVLNFPLPLLASLVLVGVLAVANILLLTRFPASYRLEPWEVTLLLAFDLLQLTALIYITGGLANPFSPLICVQVIIGFASLPLRNSMLLMCYALCCVTAIAFSPFPLPWYAGQLPPTEIVLQMAMWCAIVAMMMFSAFYTYRVSHEANQLADALAATELVLEREKHLSQLDGLAAAAAHELGTPLATISVVAKEMERDLGQDPKYGEDVQLLRSQSERCRDILRRLTTLSTSDEEHMSRMPLSSLIEEVMAPHRDFGIAIKLVERNDQSAEPVSFRNAGILYGLGNLIENAVDFATKEVIVTVSHDRKDVTIIVEDDGPGYLPDILARIGEPFVTDRHSDSRAGGLGLGLFIAKTLLERSGATVIFENRLPYGSGARISIRWPRHAMDNHHGH
jgi:two-component system sensor histidine kinase RegB